MTKALDIRLQKAAKSNPKAVDIEWFDCFLNHLTAIIHAERQTPECFVKAIMVSA